MEIYEIVNPSDPITFEAKDDLVAEACCLLVGDGKYGLTRKGGNDEDEDIGAMIAFMGGDNAEAYLKDRFGDLGEFYKEHSLDMAAALDSFLTMDTGERKDYKLAIEMIDDPEKKQKYRDEVQGRRRSSMNDIAGYAWKYAGKFREKAKSNCP